MKIRAIVLLFPILVMLSSLAIAEDVSANASANEFLTRMAAYQEEASKLSASDIFAELERLRTLQAIKQQLGQSPFKFDEDMYKATGYFKELKDRRYANDPIGAYYYGIYNLHVCGVLESADKDKQLQNTVKRYFLESMESFRIASAAHIGGASFSIGRMYENGWGVLPSKLVAADWYAKAAQQFSESGSREEALTAVEAALNLVPDFPKALRVKKLLVR